MQIQLIRHATLLIQTKTTRILLDPMLCTSGEMPPIANSTNDRRNPLVDLPVSVAEVTVADAVFLTHLHRDHFDHTAMEVIPKSMTIFCQPEDAEKLRALGFGNVIPIKDEAEWQGCKIYRTSGRHGTGEIGERMGPVSGFVFTAESEPSLYVAGDTIYCDEVEQALDEYQPEIIVVNAGAAQFASGDPITMTAEDVLSVCRRSQGAKVVAVHMEAINHCLETREHLSQFVKQNGVAHQVYIPSDGEVMTFGSMKTGKRNMSEHPRLLEAFKQTRYQVAGHGKRNIQVLKDVLEEMDGQLESDIYGQGDIIEGFQTEMAEYLGKEAAVFFPSGTMAQQIALRIWCDQRGVKRVAYHPLCHLEIHEEDGLKTLHQIQPVLLADKNRVIELSDVVNMQEDVSCVLLELPQREIGGQLPPYETLVSISEYCRENGIKLHLDGARLFEVLPYYDRTAKEVCALFDSVYVSFYKGIGGIAGAILAGDAEFTAQSKVWKRRHGGDLISLYPYIVAADHYFQDRIHKMGQYYAEAKELAQLFNQCPGVFTLPRVPVSNMFHVHFDLSKEKVEEVLVNLYRDTGVGFTGNLREISSDECSFEVSLGDQYATIPKESLKHAFDVLTEPGEGFPSSN